MAATHWGAVAELAAGQHGVFTRAQAARWDLTNAHLRTMRDRGLIAQVHRGVFRSTAAPVTWHQRVMAACLATEGCAGLRTATAVHCLDGSVQGIVEVLVQRARRNRRADVLVRSARDLDPCDLTIVEGIPVTTIPRTLCDVGAVVDDDVLERFLDDALRRGVSLTAIEETLDRVARPGPSGCGRLARVLSRPDRTGAVPGSWKERVLGRLLDHPELELVAQYEIRDARGKVIARPDWAVVDARVGVEFHSDQWHFGPRRGRRDRRRDLAAARAGWELLYLDQSDLASPDAAVEAVLDVVRRRRRELPWR